MELTELNLTEEQLAGVQKLLQSEGDKIRTEYSKKLKDLQNNTRSIDDYTELDNKYNSLVDELLELRDYKTENEEVLRQNKINEMLKEKGIEGIAKYLKFDEGTDLESYINEISETLNKQQKNFVPNSHTTQNNNITKEDFKKMNYSQRVNLYNSNKELYDILSK